MTVIVEPTEPDTAIDRLHFRVHVPGRPVIDLTVNRSTGDVSVQPDPNTIDGGQCATPESFVRTLLTRANVASSDVDEVVRQLAKLGAFKSSE